MQRGAASNRSWGRDGQLLLLHQNLHQNQNLLLDLLTICSYCWAKWQLCTSFSTICGDCRRGGLAECASCFLRVACASASWFGRPVSRSCGSSLSATSGSAVTFPLTARSKSEQQIVYPLGVCRRPTAHNLLSERGHLPQAGGVASLSASPMAAGPLHQVSTQKAQGSNSRPTRFHSGIIIRVPVASSCSGSGVRWGRAIPNLN